MAANVLSVTPPKRTVRVKGIALPNEHGSWGFLFEPLVASLAVAFSVGGLWIALLVVGAFLTRQPLKILLADWKAGRNLPQTEVALKFTAGYAAIAGVGLLGSLYFAEAKSFLPFLLIAPLAVYQIYADVLRQSRHLLPELTGAVAISSSAAVIALAGGWSWASAFGLWAIFIARLVPSIIYVRNRLRLEKGKDFSMLHVIAANFVAFGAVGILAANDLAPMLTLPVFAFLLARAVWGLSPYRRRVKAMRLGVWEVVYGVLTVLAVIVGHLLNI
jgi:hypothetical protein